MDDDVEADEIFGFDLPSRFASMRHDDPRLKKVVTTLTAELISARQTFTQQAFAMIFPATVAAAINTHTELHELKTIADFFQKLDLTLVRQQVTTKGRSGTIMQLHARIPGGSAPEPLAEAQFFLVGTELDCSFFLKTKDDNSSWYPEDYPACVEFLATLYKQRAQRN